jgi:hypothetical protein
VSGVLPKRQSDFVCLDVSSKTFPRAARIADALFKYLEATRCSMALRRDHKDGVTVSIDGQEIDIRIREALHLFHRRRPRLHTRVQRGCGESRRRVTLFPRKSLQ